MVRFDVGMQFGDKRLLPIPELRPEQPSAGHYVQAGAAGSQSDRFEFTSTD